MDAQILRDNTHEESHPASVVFLFFRGMRVKRFIHTYGTFTDFGAHSDIWCTN